MDSDWCLFCEKHVNELGALYCSKECSRKDKLMSTTNTPSSLTSASSSLSSSSARRLAAHAPLTVTYPSMFRSSTLVPSSMTNRGICKSGAPASFTPIPAATTSIRCLPMNRSSVRRQPLVLG
ncbi:hypothetical protein BGZ94_008305 [Podila epigama]|nr:hypothetical protein BGZ94_008305 [Podila epigama]